MIPAPKTPIRNVGLRPILSAASPAKGVTPSASALAMTGTSSMVGLSSL